MEGIEFTQQLKSSKNHAHIPVILLSGERNIEEQIKGINAGAEMYIFKPFYSDYLKISVNKILNRKETLKSYFNSPKSAYDLSNAKLIHKEDKKFIETILDIINANLDNKDLSAAFIANELHISMRHLYRKLSEIGEVRSIANMIKDCKLQVAKTFSSIQSFRLTKLPINQVSPLEVLSSEVLRKNITLLPKNFANNKNKITTILSLLYTKSPECLKSHYKGLNPASGRSYRVSSVIEFSITLFIST